jgi:hypothetical protein
VGNLFDFKDFLNTDYNRKLTARPTIRANTRRQVKFLLFAQEKWPGKYRVGKDFEMSGFIARRFK